jgi:ubiquinol-cytochrome c reductase cytochrome b subunit
VGISKHSAGLWIEERTGVPGMVRKFGAKTIPASAGWPHVLGSIALFLFFVQFFTGVLLALNYSASPAAAWNSIRYIDSQAAAGGLIRGLHHWGSSAMIVVVVAHMTQVFLAGAYRKPREATWMAGVVLLLLTAGFGLTGYLLPWDNRGYWGTVVTTQIALQVPGAGPFAASLLGGAHVGAVTLARFFALHSIVFPILGMTLIAFHLAMVIRHGVTPSPGETAVPATFYPAQALKDAVAVFACFVLLFAAALFVKVPLERIADPNDLTYMPRPDWYFLFLFELLKFFRGALEPVGTAVLPGLAVVVLMLAPFIDRAQRVRIQGGVLRVAIVVFAFSAWAGLTWGALAAPAGGGRVTSHASRGAEIYQANECAGCHSLDGSGGQIGPALDGVASRHSRAWMHRHFLSPPDVVPGSIMPAYHFSESDESALIDFLTQKRDFAAHQQ